MSKMPEKKMVRACTFQCRRRSDSDIGGHRRTWLIVARLMVFVAHVAREISALCPSVVRTSGKYGSFNCVLEIQLRASRINVWMFCPCQRTHYANRVHTYIVQTFRSGNYPPSLTFLHHPQSTTPPRRKQLISKKAQLFDSTRRCCGGSRARSGSGTGAHTKCVQTKRTHTHK